MPFTLNRFRIDPFYVPLDVLAAYQHLDPQGPRLRLQVALNPRIGIWSFQILVPVNQLAIGACSKRLGGSQCKNGFDDICLTGPVITVKESRAGAELEVEPPIVPKVLELKAGKDQRPVPVFRPRTAPASVGQATVKECLVPKVQIESTCYTRPPYFM